MRVAGRGPVRLTQADDGVSSKHPTRPPRIKFRLSEPVSE